MSLPDFPQQGSLFSVENLLGGQFPANDRFRLFAQQIYPLLCQARPQLQGTYCADNGRQAIEPVLLLGVCLLQFMERQPDRQAAEMLKYHLGWKLALQTDLDLEGFDPSSLVYFRRRLLENHQAKLAFDVVLKGLQEAGLVRARGKRRLDSTHVLGLVARLSLLELLPETLRMTLQELAKRAEVTWPPFWEAFWEQYVQGKRDWRMEEAAVSKRQLQCAQDMQLLLS